MSQCWDVIKTNLANADAVYLLGCLDECDESQASWLISRIRQSVRTVDAPLKVVITTTKGSDAGQKITDALAQLPDRSVATVDFSGVQMARNHKESELQLSLFLQEDPRYTQNSIPATLEKLYSSCREDEELKLLLVASLKSSPNHKQTMHHLESGPRTRDQIFAIALETIAKENMPRALAVFSWLLTIRRPLRVFEFVTLCQLSESACEAGCSHRWLSRRSPKIHYEAAKILRQLGNLLRIKHDEVHFSHPEIRSWLLSKDGKSSSAGNWLDIASENERHGHILDLCTKCLSHLTGEHNIDALFAYAAEHWIHHYRNAEDSRHQTILKDVFARPEIVDKWIVAYRRLPTPFMKPQDGTSNCLVIASHFALDSIVRALLAQQSPDIEIWKSAVLECVSMGNLSTLCLVYEAIPVTLDFDSPILHQIINKAAVCGHLNVFRDIVQRIPVPSHVESPLSSGETRPESNDLPSIVHELPAEAKSDASTTMVDDVFGIQNVERPTTQHEKQYRSNMIEELPKIRTDIPQDREPPGEGSFTNGDDGKSLNTRTSSPAMRRPSPFDWLDLVVCKAARLGLDDILDTLLSLGANPNSESSIRPRLDNIGICALAHAGFRGHLDAMRVLLLHGANIERKSGRHSGTSLSITAEGGSVEAVKLLLDKGADVEAPDKRGWAPVCSATYWGLYAAAKTLIDHTPLNEYEQPPRELLPDAVDEGRYNTAKTLLECGADPNSANADGTALWHAIAQERMDLCELLLNDGQPWKADPDFTPEGLTPPLVQAIIERNLDIVKLLLERGADIEKMEISHKIKRTPLTTAVLEKDTAIVQYLLEQNANALVVDEEGWTPIFSAANYGVSIRRWSMIFTRNVH